MPPGAKNCTILVYLCTLSVNKKPSASGGDTLAPFLEVYQYSTSVLMRESDKKHADSTNPDLQPL